MNNGKLADDFLVERNCANLWLHCQNTGIHFVKIYEKHCLNREIDDYIRFHCIVFSVIDIILSLQARNQLMCTSYHHLPLWGAVHKNIKPPSFLVPWERSGCTLLSDDQSSVRLLSEHQLLFNLQSNIYFINRIVCIIQKQKFSCF